MVTYGRHPFVRLVSTYKDKLIDEEGHRYKKLMNYDEKHPYSVCNNVCVYLGTLEYFAYLMIDDSDNHENSDNFVHVYKS